MSKRYRKKRKERKAFCSELLFRLQSLAKPLGFEVRVLNAYPMHLRVFGVRTLDYWPATGRAWECGTEHKANIMEPEDVIAKAQEPDDLHLPEGAMDHLRSLQ